MEALNYLDTVLPNGSRVVFIGLIDGRILYNTMGERIHPIGVTELTFPLLVLISGSLLFRCFE